MDGDNKVECELCATKKAAVRRTCFGALPNFLILHLKRFDLDFTTFETVKLNNRCSFPLTLNMKPYTKQGLEEREAAVRSNGKAIAKTNEDTTTTDDDVDMNETDEASVSSAAAAAGDRDCEYRLKGILVHSGVAQGGHYYSFIYDHASDKWFKYDDEVVSPFDPANIESECFGGVQRRTWHGSNSSMEMEVFSNALMLFYEKVEPTDTPYAESLLATQGKLPHPYETEVWKTNEAFLQNSYVLDVEFHEFLREMVLSKYLKNPLPPEATESTDDTLALPPAVPSSTGGAAPDEAIQAVLAYVGTEFVMNVLLHSREKHGIARWITVLSSKFVKHKSICVQFFESMATAAKQEEWTRAILFESSDSIARQSFVHLTSRALTAFENHLRATGPTPADVELLHKWMDAIVDLLDQTSVSQQSHLEEVFMLIRNAADISTTLREHMRSQDMIARLVDCFLGERAPPELKAAFHSTHTMTSTNRYATPDFQYLLEAIIAILGFPRRTTEPLVNESSTHYPHRVTLSEKAEQALTAVFEQYQDAERGCVSADELKRYLSVCLSCSVATSAVQHKAHGILAKYGKQHASPSPSTPTELELDGFLTYYTDVAAAASKNVYQDLRAHGYGEDLQRRGERALSLSSDVVLGVHSLSDLSRSALLNEVFFDSALEEDAETVGDMLLRIVEGEKNASGLLLRSLLQCMASTETGWKGQPVVDACAQMLQTMLSRPCDYQSEMIDLVMVHPEFGLLTTAENRERVRQRYTNSNLVSLFVFRQISVVVELHSKISEVAAWLQEHRQLWEWMYEWLRLESLRPALGGRLSVLYREASKLETLCRLGEALAIPYRDEERSFIVEGAGTDHVNGVYKSTSQLHDNCTIYTCVKENMEYTLFRCSMPSKARRWYISYSPNRALLGTVSDEDYYYVACHFDDDAPPETGWRVWTKNDKALPGAPTVRLYSSTVSLDGHAAAEDGHADMDGGGGSADVDGDMDADADTVEYDDSEDEIRVSNERFQAVHLDNQDSESGADDFM